MIEITVIRTQDGRLAPATEYDMDLLMQMKTGQAVKMTAIRMSERSLIHHKMFFGGLIKFAMDYWEPAGGLIKVTERNILRMFLKRLEKSMGKQQPELREFIKRFLHNLERSRARHCPASTKSTEGFLDWLKLEVGYCHVYQTPNGFLKLPKSINFNTMDQEQFNVFYKQCFDVIWRTVLHYSFDTEEDAQNAIDTLLSMG